MEKVELVKMLEEKEKYLENLKAEMYGTVGQIQILKDIIKKQENESSEGK